MDSSPKLPLVAYDDSSSEGSSNCTTEKNDTESLSNIPETVCSMTDLLDDFQGEMEKEEESSANSCVKRKLNEFEGFMDSLQSSVCEVEGNNLLMTAEDLVDSLVTEKELADFVIDKELDEIVDGRNFVRLCNEQLEGLSEGKDGSECDTNLNVSTLDTNSVGDNNSNCTKALSIINCQSIGSSISTIAECSNFSTKYSPNEQAQSPKSQIFSDFQGNDDRNDCVKIKKVILDKDNIKHMSIINSSILNDDSIKDVEETEVRDLQMTISKINASTLVSKNFLCEDFQFENLGQDLNLDCSDSRLDNLEEEDISYSASNSVLPSPSTDAPTPVRVIPFEDESLSSIDQIYSQGNSRSQTPTRIEIPPIPVDEESMSSVLSAGSAIKKRRLELGDAENLEPVTAHNVLEYLWPPNDSNSEYYMLQEQVSEYLNITSFKRRYPDLKRRIVDMDERTFLKSKGVINNTIVDMGLTALLSQEVFDIMFTDFPDKYEELRKVMRDSKEKLLLAQKAKSSILLDKAKAQESQKHSVRRAADWNAQFNRTRKEKRQTCLDMQTYCVHYPKTRKKVIPLDSKSEAYPCALLPGQFSDHFKMYSPTELRYLPLNSVIYGPVWPRIASDNYGLSDGSISLSDDSSSDDDEEEDEDDSCSSLTSQDSDYQGDKKGNSGLTCIICSGNQFKNKNGIHEELVTCSDCKNSGHPSCIDISLDVVPHILSYSWQCMDCKTCFHCKDPDDEDKMIFCDQCDRGYHIYCIGLRKVPTGRWHCSVCAMCCSCGTKELNVPDNASKSAWQFEIVKTPVLDKAWNTFCQACHKMYKKNKFCSVCFLCHSNPSEVGMLQCIGCEKWTHTSCDQLILEADGIKPKSYICFQCQASGKRMKTQNKMMELQFKR